MSKRELMYAETSVVKDTRRKHTTAARVPAAAKNFIGACIGDTLVFEEGTTWAAERAAARGPYVILRLKDRKTAEPSQETEAAPEVVGHVADTESLESLVQRKREGAR